ncbi:ribosome recycling factor family protein [uncultured Vibrio sp.]|uniref:ribosome recycling factor family protein n=1 Tax=uncultured Vibrio sp. TaxID=114054 RepID=UPI0025FE7D21|nr:ribosome recycling factor family protein [uncultured Vibrio sp.]
MTKESVCIALPSLIHRMGGERVKQAKMSALEYQCELKRVRRSRNWQLVGEPHALAEYRSSFSHDHDDPFVYLIKKLDHALSGLELDVETMEEKLEKIIKGTPNVTLAELIQMTDCTTAQARRARFDLDIL